VATDFPSELFEQMMRNLDDQILRGFSTPGPQYVHLNTDPPLPPNEDETHCQAALCYIEAEYYLRFDDWSGDTIYEAVTVYDRRNARVCRGHLVAIAREAAQRKLRIRFYQLGDVTHAMPPDRDVVMPCCQRTPFEVPRTDHMTADPSLVTCHPIKV
jgi:hypothetical protein